MQAVDWLCVGVGIGITRNKSHCSTFLSWLLQDTTPEEFSGKKHNIYDTSHHQFWLKEKLPQPLNQKKLALDDKEGKQEVTEEVSPHSSDNLLTSSLSSALFATSIKNDESKHDPVQNNSSQKNSK